MTLGRQRGGRRAQTVPVPAMSDIFPSSIEESLQDWLKQRSQPDLPESPQPAEGICECCRQPDCPHFEALASTISKLEGDARLAAGKEIPPPHHTDSPIPIPFLTKSRISLFPLFPRFYKHFMGCIMKCNRDWPKSFAQARSACLGIHPN